MEKDWQRQKSRMLRHDTLANIYRGGNYINTLAFENFTKYMNIFYSLLLAILHYNENSGRSQALNRDGKPIYVIRLPKYKKGEHTVQAKLVPPSFSKFNNNNNNDIYLESNLHRMFN